MDFSVFVLIKLYDLTICSLYDSGTIISRPSAKKQSMEAEASVSVDMSTESKLEDASKSRLGKSKLRIIIQRLFRLRLLVVVAAVSGPVYMMLLFKDWIDR